MRKDFIGWAIIAFAFLVPFNYVYFHIDDSSMASWQKAVGFLFTLFLLYIGYDMVGKYKEKHKKSHH